MYFTNITDLNTNIYITLNFKLVELEQLCPVVSNFNVSIKIG